MAKETIIFVLQLYFIMMMGIGFPLVHSYTPKDPESVEKWFDNLPTLKQKSTKLRFFYHDVISGKNPSTVTVAQSNNTLQSPTFFGLVEVIDAPLTVGPEPDSQIIGRAQGIYVLASLEELSLFMSFNLVFTDGMYNGSTLSVLGHNPIFHKYREMAIVGGSGVFRLARGIAATRTVWLNLTTGDGVSEYHVVALHH
ncbi:dirigent protein 22-like [Henckelia pumila]|uniref:dirigent protein 22-like n=1 Tax=Henckelia pumila TaxID=405737 RepID=UPI003C6E6C35